MTLLDQPNSWFTFPFLQDKTFGLKNKKGTKQQKFIQQVQKQVFTPNQKASQSTQQQQLLKKKEEEKKKREELNDLFRPVQSVGKGKTTLNAADISLPSRPFFFILLYRDAVLVS